MKIISWNMAGRKEAWYYLLESGADIALVQEAGPPPTDIISEIGLDDRPWQTTARGKKRKWRTAIVRLSDRVDVEWLPLHSLEGGRPKELAYTSNGTLSIANVGTEDEDGHLTLISAYSLWESCWEGAKGHWIYADASAHRLISDISALVGHPTKHRIIVAGDFNILYGYGENGDSYFEKRYATVFERMKTIGLPFIGPQSPNGRQADPWPDELPQSSLNVPTFHTNRQTPHRATRQLDFVFCSESLSSQLGVRALNQPNEWGPSDHCCIEIIYRSR